MSTGRYGNLGGQMSKDIVVYKKPKSYIKIYWVFWIIYLIKDFFADKSDDDAEFIFGYLFIPFVLVFAIN